MLLLWWSISILFGMHKDLIPVTKTAPLFVNITCSCPPSIAIQTLKAAEYALLDVITSQDKWRPLTALVWQNPTIQRIVPPAFSAGEDEISVSTSHRSSLLPHKSKFNSSWGKICGQKNKEGHWLQIHPPISHTKSHTLPSLQGAPTTKVTEELSWC